MNAPTSKLRRVLRGLTISCAVLLLALLGLELWLRSQGYARSPAQYFDPDVGYRFHPGQVRKMVGEDPRHGVSVRLNHQGYRGPFPRHEKPSGTLRVACLGDSFTFGWGVVDGEEYPARLSQRLGAGGREAPVEVLNFGVPGYNFYNSLQTYRHVARSYRPDVVILGFVLNDLEPEIQLPPYTNDLLPRLFGRTALFEAWHRHLRPRTGRYLAYGGEGPNPLRRLYFDNVAQVRDEPRSEIARPFWDRMIAQLEELAREVRADGARLLLVAFPGDHQVAAARLALAEPGARLAELAGELAPAQAHLRERSEKLDLAFLDLLETFVACDEGTWSEISKGHPGPGALSATAARIHEELARLGWISAESTGHAVGK